MKIDGWMPATLMFGVAVLGSIVHSSLEPTDRTWAEFLPSLYYIPIVIAAIGLGTRAAVGVAMVAGAAQAIAFASAGGDAWTRPFGEALLFVLVGLMAARLSHPRPAVKPANNVQGRLPVETGGDLFRDAQRIRELPAFGQVVSGLVRRFRTPVSSIEGAVWLLGDVRLPGEKREEFVQIIRRESLHLDRALSDIQEYTQPCKPRFRKASLSQLMDEVIELAGPKEHGPFFLFRKDVPPDVGALICDPGQIRNMLLNLAMNAIQATPQGGQILFAAQMESDRVVVSFTDHGRGVAPEILDRIFEPFFTTRESGLGLGLTVARQIAVAHGGDITVEPGPERGTRVSVVLPLDPSKSHEHGTDTRS